MGHLMTHKFLDNLICNSQASCTNVFITFHSVFDITHIYSKHQLSSTHFGPTRM